MPGSPIHNIAPILGARLGEMLEHADVCVYAKSREGRYLYANRALCTLYGTTADLIIGASDERFLDTDRSPAVARHDDLVLRAGQDVHAQEEVALWRGGRRLLWSARMPLYDEARAIVGLLGISTDITHRYGGAALLAQRGALLDALLANAEASIYLKDEHGCYLYANRMLSQLYGLPFGEIVGHTDDELLPADVAERIAGADRDVLASGSRSATEEMRPDADGVERRFRTTRLPLALPGRPPCVIGFASDITELALLRETVAQQRITDPLTGLPNRAQFEQELGFMLRLAARERSAFGVVLLDIDHFKYLNNSLGQHYGDECIREMAARLRRHAPAGATLARLTGDEFALLVVGEAAEVAATVARLCDDVAGPCRLKAQSLHLTVSAGISLYPQDSATPGALLGHAEAAMYHAKERGRDQFRFYSQELGSAVQARLSLERDLRAALAADQFELYYQPKVRRVDGSVAGVEALLRWNRNGHGMVVPGQFLALAEQLGLLGGLGAWIIESACRQIACWREMGFGEVAVSVNLSPTQLTSRALPAHVARTLAVHEVGAHCLEMEITESMMMDDPELAIVLLRELRAGGVRLSIDDFGTGYSSMAYLKRMPVHTLKLDRQFVTNIASDGKDADLASGIIALAHKLELDVVAEGVETAAQRDTLATLGCDQFQGYLYSAPLPVAQATAFLAARRMG